VKDVPDAGYPMPGDVNKRRAVYLQDAPRITVDPGQELSILIDFVIAVYSRTEISTWLATAEGGAIGDPWSINGVRPEVTLRWDFRVESYVAK
jgi:hypothetical protein